MATGLFNLKQVNQAISQGAWSGYIAPKWVEYLVVAGGGGGRAGGSGGGGLLTGIVTVATGTSYTVTVGGGGSTGANGSDSVFGSIAATGGATGASGGAVANSGGSGGAGYGTSTYTAGAFGVSGQGNAGGAGNTTAGGGGGGAGTIGIAATSTAGGNGGAGIASAISGTVVTYAGGSGGGGSVSGGTGGVGGGGTGAVNAATAGGGNTGGGGGSSYNGPAAAGGSGIVVVRYPGNVQFFTGGTVTYSNGYIVHNFTSSGTLAPTTPAVVSDYQITRSLRFNQSDSAYLNRTPASATNQKTWTWSAWVKRGTISSLQTLFGTWSANTDAAAFAIYFNSGDTLNVIPWTNTIFTSTAVFRDPSAWYHIVVAFDSTQAIASNRIIVYVNGVNQAGTYPLAVTQNTNYAINSAQAHRLGDFPASGFNTFGGYMTEVNFIDGQQLTPTSFGYVSPTTGVWSPAKYVGAYGTNGFYVNFSDNSNTTAATLGKDYSGNGNNWTPNNFSVTAGVDNDSMVDSPTPYGTDAGAGGEARGNYCTLNPLTTTAGTYSQGNLRYLGNSASFRRSNGTISVSTGKWYWEVTLANAPGTPRSNVSEYNAFGFGLSTVFNSTTSPNASTDALVLEDSGYYKNFSGAQTDSGTAFLSGDVLSVAVDLDANTFTFRRNNTSLVTGTIGGTVGRELAPILISYDGLRGIMDCNFGQRPFAYTAPSGYKALCTQNLPTPTIGATTATQAGKYFNPVLYTGTGATNSITGVGFQPDFVWIKARSSAYSNRLADSVRGAGKELFSNETVAETTNSANGYVSSFNSDGFSLTSGVGVNGSATTFVAWNWKANGSGSTNTAGSITTTVSANTTSGFSVAIGTTPSSGSATYGHGLGVAPSFIFAKSTAATSDWFVYHTSLGFNQDIRLNNTSAVSSTTFTYNSANSSTVTIGGSSVAAYWGGNASWIWYNFAEVAGYSKFGSYTGNGSSDGPFVYCGFKPAFVLIKGATDASANWLILDSARNTYNLVTNKLAPNLTAVENDASIGTSTENTLDFLSNGFKVRTGNGSTNGSSQTLIFAAFAQNPFKYSLAR